MDFLHNFITINIIKEKAYNFRNKCIVDTPLHKTTRYGEKSFD